MRHSAGCDVSEHVSEPWGRWSSCCVIVDKPPFSMACAMVERPSEIIKWAIRLYDIMVVNGASTASNWRRTRICTLGTVPSKVYREHETDDWEIYISGNYTIFISSMAIKFLERHRASHEDICPFQWFDSADLDKVWKSTWLNQDHFHTTAYRTILELPTNHEVLSSPNVDSTDHEWRIKQMQSCLVRSSPGSWISSKPRRVSWENTKHQSGFSV